MLVPTSQITCHHDPQGPQYECELVDKDLQLPVFKRSTKKTCIYASLVKLCQGALITCNTLTKLYIDMCAYTGVAEVVKHFKILVMRFSAKVSVCTGV